MELKNKNNNIDFIIKDLSKLGAKDGLKNSENFLIQLQNKIEKYLKKINIVYSNLEKEKNLFLRSGLDLSVSSMFEVAKKTSINATLLQEGLLLSNKIRELFTKQEINYTVVIPYYGNVYLKNMRLEDFIKYSGLSVDHSTKELKLKVTAARYKLLEIEKNQKEIAQKYNLTKLSEKEKSIYDTLLEMRKIYGANRGHVAEAFVRWRETGSRKKNLGDILKSVLSNVTEGSKAGDVGLTQVKNYNASLESFNSVRETLEKINNALKTKSLKELQKILIERFTDSKAEEKIDKSAANEAKRNIKEVIKELSF